MKDLLPYVFKVNREVFNQEDQMEPLIKREDKKDIFLDSVIFGCLINKKEKEDIQKFKALIRD